MSDIEAPLDDEIEAVDDTLEDESESQTEQVDDDPVASLKAQVEELKAQIANPAWMKEFKTEVGRMRSIEARLSKAEDPAERASLQASLTAKLSENEEMLASIIANLDETAFADPAAKAQAQKFLAERQKKAELDALKSEIRSELTPKFKPSYEDDWREAPEIKAWEETTADFVEDAGFDPDSDELKPAWRAAAAILAQNRDRRAATKAVRDHLATLKAERDSAAKRQTAKKNAGVGTPRGTGGAVGQLDPSRPLAERAAYLRSLGVQVGHI